MRWRLGGPARWRHKIWISARNISLPLLRGSNPFRNTFVLQALGEVFEELLELCAFDTSFLMTSAEAGPYRT